MAKLKSKYDTEAINYFYETVFHEDYSKIKLDNISKWKSNPKIVLLGHPSSSEIEYVKKSIAEINKLNLPIECILGEPRDSGSINILFGNFEEVSTYLNLDNRLKSEIDTSAHFGIGHVTSQDGEISKAGIGICYNKNDSAHLGRQNVVLEEIVQSLGIGGDSYTHPRSLFFQNYNPEKSFTNLDRQLLSLLYEPAIPVNFPRKSFETDFSDVLYAVNTAEKIKNLWQKFPRDLDSEVERCFTGAGLLKHPKETNIHLYGSVDKEDSATITRVIFSLNQISPNLTLKLARRTAFEPDHGVVLTFNESDQQKEAIRLSNEVSMGKSCMFPKLIKSKISLSFNKSARSRILRQQSIVDALYFSLLTRPKRQTDEGELFEIKAGVIHFHKRYTDLLKLIYSNEFLDGLALNEFRAAKSM
ncbi:DUF2927 domain-containing protein [Dyadobacter diqingensis]|uniref:DUF2927 domain-containing protein n=1 Tax=Dyadobacter diqingensis TaxID=2938121 RepID=UPI0020C18ECB|nr:DUF2927 domain-containing protein [Dyadobacter diqingensis]